MATHPYPEVAAEVVRIIDPASLGVPRGHGANVALKGLSKRLCFDSSVDLSNLYGSFGVLTLYGFLDRAVPAALALRGVPNGTPSVQYSYLHSSITRVCYFAHRAGDTTAAEALADLATNAPGDPYLPLPRALDGSMLKDVFSGPADSHDLRVGEALNDLSVLCGMWLFGSPTPVWTRERIETTIEAGVAHILSLRKWQPWR
ncbi:MAG: hypothetical protein QM779_07425 [Propionicimonas sp.]|uniref:hypothetical protein n=1 Tax=Propionicimonas sp. TaxID=1955623 RepID=UPI003D10D26C